MRRALLIVAVAVIGILGLTACGGDSKASPQAVAFVDHALVKLDAMQKKFDNGNVNGALALWKSLGAMPTSENNASDQVLKDDFTTYANNLRYYLIGDASMNLQKLESSRQQVETTLQLERP